MLRVREDRYRKSRRHFTRASNECHTRLRSNHHTAVLHRDTGFKGQREAPEYILPCAVVRMDGCVALVLEVMQ